MKGSLFFEFFYSFGYWSAVFVSSIILVGSVYAVPPAQQRDGEASTFIPNAGYAATVRLKALERRRLQAMMGPNANMAPSDRTRLSGQPKIPVICVKYKNSGPDPFKPEILQEALFGVSDGGLLRPTLSQYYRDMSNGHFRPSGEVIGWVPLAEDDTYYEGSGNGFDAGSHLESFVREALIGADATTDFALFDNDGPDRKPNSGDDDGVVDTVFIVHPENGGECDGSTNIWSHSSNYSHLAPDGSSFSTNDPRRNSLGEIIPGEFIKIDDYTVQPALACGDEDKMISIGVFCHEYGHALGLPDLYDRTPQSSPDSQGVGNYCCMASGSYGASGVNPERPVQMSAWCKAYLGWADIDTIRSSGEYPLIPVQASNHFYAIDVPNTGGKEYFLIEYRPATWSDSFNEKLNWDSDFRVDGLYIWHVDENVGASSVTWPFAGHNRGQNDSPSLPRNNRYPQKHSLVALLQADRKLHLERNQNRGGEDDHADDLFVTGMEFGDDPSLICGSRGYSGEPTGIAIKGVRLTSTESTLFVEIQEDGGVSAAAAPAAAAVAPPPAAPPPAAPSPPSTAAPASIDSVKQEIILMPDRWESGEKFASSIPDLHKLEIKIAKSGEAALTPADKDFLKTIDSTALRAGLSSANSANALRISSKLRTMTLDQAGESQAAVANAVSDLVEKYPEVKGSAQIRLSPNEEKIEKITGLEISSGEADLISAAKAQVGGELLELLGSDLKLRPASDASKEGGSVVFDQLIAVGEKEIPINHQTVTLYYDASNTLQAFENETVKSEGLEIAGNPGDLSATQAKKIVVDTLGISEALIKGSAEVIQMDELQPKKGRLMQKVSVAPPGKGKDIEILVDSVTKQILPITRRE